MKAAISEFAEDFGYDLDEEGQPLDDDAPIPSAPRRDVRLNRRRRRRCGAESGDGGRDGLAARAATPMASQREVRNRIASFKNIQKITQAMEAVSAARLRRAEQRIAALRPYAEALRRMTRQAAKDAGAEASRLPLLRAARTREPRRDPARHRPTAASPARSTLRSCAPGSAWAPRSRARASRRSGSPPGAAASPR